MQLHVISMWFILVGIKMKLILLFGLFAGAIARESLETYEKRFFKSKPTRDSFKVAVYDQTPPDEYTKSVPPTREEALRIVQKELDIYEEQARKASENGVDIITFPEYGILPRGTSRDTVLPFLEQIPSPESNPIPCSDPASFNSTQILQKLSCIARKQALYIVANMGDVKYCDPNSEACNPSGRLQYNTNVVFDPNGQLIARYHKQNLFFEFRFDTPKTTDYSYFDTPFGRFGTFICFDILFETPAIKLVNEYEIDHVLFPTAWMNVYPYFSAVPFHQSFAIGHGVNFLGANLRNPAGRFSGSGIYAGNTTVAFHNDLTSDTSLLLIGTLPSTPEKIKRLDVEFTLEDEGDWREPEFQGEVFGDMYNFILLEKKSDNVMICHSETCCHLSYKRRDEEDQANEELFALGAFRGLHTKEGTYFIEVCAFVKCAGTSRETCGAKVTHSVTFFQQFNLTGNFTTRYVYPQVTTDNVDPAAGHWNYDGKSITSNGSDKPFLNAIFFARRYDLDLTGKTVGNLANSLQYSTGMRIVLSMYFLVRITFLKT